MYTGLAGLLLGYAFLLLAPGNYRRMLVEQDGTHWLTTQVMTEQFGILFTILLFQFFLWYFSLRSLHKLKQRCWQEIHIRKEFILLVTLSVMAFAISAIMVFSPRFPPRSGFFGTILLIIVNGILLRIQMEHNIVLLQDSVKKFLFSIGIFYFVMTSIITFHHYYIIHEQFQVFLSDLTQAPSETVFIIKPFRKASSIEERLSGFHILYYNLSADEHNPSNIAFSRYYKIKGIKMVQEQE